jgi:wyosine [tRNA(Phe)-imidazoG37] synthetase (radical SAM superfamily)
MRVLYGPVDSWRLGRSQGIDPLARRHKICPFSCVYCQYGKTSQPTLRRQIFVTPERLQAELQAARDISADCITFAGLGEPTLASNLPALVAVVRKRHAQPVVLLTGSALLPSTDVRHDITCFDHVVATLNAADESMFRQLNCPPQGYPYSLSAIVDGLRRFRMVYSGKLILQIMLVQANQHTAPQIAALARSLQPDEVQLNTPREPGLGGPLSVQELRSTARAFEGLPVRSVYDRDVQFRPRSM